MRELIAYLFDWQVVYLRDVDGEVVKRLAQLTPYGMLAYRMSRTFKLSPVICEPDGRVSGCSYVTEWRAA